MILRNTALTYAACLAPMRKEMSRLKLPPGSCFELMGIDYLIDDDFHPWLLEVNSTPSLAVEHSDAAGGGAQGPWGAHMHQGVEEGNHF